MPSRTITGKKAIRLDGQVAAITGGGRGLGRAIALALGDAGAAVAVCARSGDEIRNVARDISSLGGRALAVVCDVARRSEVERMVRTVEESLGPVDLLVNNAGVFGPVGALADTDPDTWWRVMEVNLRGPLYCSRAVLPGMITRGHGRIINVSTSAALAAVPMLSAYVVSKTALYRFSENLAAETRAQGVMVFCVTPGLVRTAMSESAQSCGEPTIEQWFSKAFADEKDVPADVPAGRVVYLASGAAEALTVRAIPMSDDVEAMVTRVTEIEEQDLYVLKGSSLH